jgi:diguanylate cyclase
MPYWRFFRNCPARSRHIIMGHGITLKAAARVMSSKPPTGPAASGAPHPTSAQNPADIAREAFRRLATRRIAPTPEAYRDIYNEIAGLSQAPIAAILDHGAEQMLTGLLASFNAVDLSGIGRTFKRAVAARDWDACARTLSQLLERPIETAAIADDEPARMLRDMLSRSLSFAIASLLTENPALAAEAQALGSAVKQADTAHEQQAINLRLKQLCYQIELTGGDAAERQELLLRLFNLLLENVGELLDNDNWLRGQIDAVRDLIAGPIDYRALEEATRSLKEVIYKQGQLKHSLSDAKLTMKNMMITFTERLGQVAASTGDFHRKIGDYSKQIKQAGNLGELNQILDDVLRDTRIVQTEALQAHDNMLLARQEVHDAEVRIDALQAQLQSISALVHQDQLTGSLNRRGLDDVYARESARSDRRGTPLCIAMLDLDDFKRINDTYGHVAGDAALKHLVTVVKDTLRSMDVIARFGGEEFLILLPETTIEAATHTMTRLQRELTRHFFLHDNEKVLITFSAGVALRLPNEAQDALIQRTDRAMYQAKRAGKNLVVVAPDAMT